MKIDIRQEAGSFAENKDVARMLRETRIEPALASEEEIILDFDGVEGATQSFMHALISQCIRNHGPEALDRIAFKGCNPTIRKIVEVVADYMQEA